MNVYSAITFSLLWFFYLLTLAWGSQITIQHQEQGLPDVKSITFEEGQKPQKSFNVKTNDTVSVQLAKFNQKFDHVFVVAVNKKPNHPRLRFPAIAKLESSTSSLNFNLKTNIFQGETGKYQLSLEFLRSSELAFSIDLGVIDWKYISPASHSMSHLPPLKYEFPDESHPSSPVLAWSFSMALLIPWFLLLASWRKIVSQMEFRLFPASLPFAFCMVAFLWICYMFWTQWNLLETLPYLVGVFIISAPISRALLRRMNQWKKV
ncbi:hypothetical protein HMI54_007609 [Coelomomyces lativittatus]|nr:hypothetical protein HMI56_000010 [Coelomomyces lativittatus]KAJ1516029.1 hypothetical protein HMI55_003109 [Coelomomyces lativittatus]KAJ1516946.1 hypothetical protein HMI54_007609 [Coelomomyces lativittatus]